MSEVKTSSLPARSVMLNPQGNCTGPTLCMIFPIKSVSIEFRRLNYKQITGISVSDPVHIQYNSLIYMTDNFLSTPTSSTSAVASASLLY